MRFIRDFFLGLLKIAAVTTLGLGLGVAAAALFVAAIPFLIIGYLVCSVVDIYRDDGPTLYK